MAFLNCFIGVNQNVMNLFAGLQIKAQRRHLFTVPRSGGNPHLFAPNHW